MFKFDSNKNLLNFLDKANFKWNNSLYNKFGPFSKVLENFPNEEEIQKLSKISKLARNRTKCLCLWDKKFGIFAYSDKYLIVSYSIIKNSEEIGQMVLTMKKSKSSDEKYMWEILYDNHSFSFKNSISYEECGNKFSRLNAAKARSIVKRFANELSK